MNQKQSELLQYVLEEVGGNIHDSLESFIEYNYFESAQEMLNGLKHIAGVIKNIDGTIKRADMKWVLDYLFGEDKLDETSKMFDLVNARYELCTEDEVNNLVDTLFLVWWKSNNCI